MYCSSLLGTKGTGIHWVIYINRYQSTSVDTSTYLFHVIKSNCLRSFALDISMFIKQKQEAENKTDTKLISTNTLTKN